MTWAGKTLILSATCSLSWLIGLVGFIATLFRPTAYDGVWLVSSMGLILGAITTLWLGARIMEEIDRLDHARFEAEWAEL